MQVCAFDLNSVPAKGELSVVRHRELAGKLLSRYEKAVGESKSADAELMATQQQEFNDLLKHLQSLLKSVSNNTLLSAQLEAMRQSFDAAVDPADLQHLAHKFVLVHNVRPDSRSFAGLLSHGMVFALQNAPNKLDFLHALIPFVQRAGLDDLKHWCARTHTHIGGLGGEGERPQWISGTARSLRLCAFLPVCLCQRSLVRTSGHSLSVSVGARGSQRGGVVGPAVVCRCAQ